MARHCLLRNYQRTPQKVRSHPSTRRTGTYQLPKALQWPKTNLYVTGTVRVRASGSSRPVILQLRERFRSKALLYNAGTSSGEVSSRLTKARRLQLKDAFLERRRRKVMIYIIVFVQQTYLTTIISFFSLSLASPSLRSETRESWGHPSTARP